MGSWGIEIGELGKCERLRAILRVQVRIRFSLSEKLVRKNVKICEKHVTYNNNLNKIETKTRFYFICDVIDRSFSLFYY